MVATDLFQWEQNNYLVVADYYSRYIEVVKLENTTSRAVVNHMKSIFAQHGIPSVVRRDNGPQYTATEYKQFAQKWNFEHQTSSPYYPKSNGLAEKAVQIGKRLLSKAKQDGKDPYLSLLECRNTPTGNVASPAQILMSRRLRSHLPTTQNQLQPKLVDPERMKEKFEEKKTKQKRYYDRGSTELPAVQVQNKWKPAVIKEKLETPRSYIVQTPNGQRFRRNRNHIRKQKYGVEISRPWGPIEDFQSDGAREVREEQVSEPSTGQYYKTRSGRLSKPPERYQAC
jgi:hypothetical protein